MFVIRWQRTHWDVEHLFRLTILRRMRKNGVAYLGSWERVIRWVILLWIVSFTLIGIPAFDRLEPTLSELAALSDATIQLFFPLEFIIRLLISKPRRRYLFSIMGIIDFLVSLPVFLIIFGVSPMEVANDLRIVQILCIFKLARFNERVPILKHAFWSIRKELLFFVSLFSFLLYFLSLGIFLAEGKAQPQHFGSVLDGLWFAVESLTTVGYGDAIPITPLGKLFTSAVLIVGVALIAIPTSLITSALSRLWMKEEQRSERLRLFRNSIVERRKKRIQASIQRRFHSKRSKNGAKSRQILEKSGKNESRLRKISPSK